MRPSAACPFCPGDDLHCPEVAAISPGVYAVTCGYCLARGPTGADQGTAVELWNRWEQREPTDLAEM